MTVEENIPLAQYTTFKMGGPARYFSVVHNESEVLEAVKFAKETKIPFFIIGGGSNILISDNGFPGLVIKMENTGIVYEGDRVTAAAGENWDDFVADTVAHGFHGLENLSSIPGTVGASAVQNIGAYGSDVSTAIESVRVLDVDALKVVDLSNSECGFVYRDSLFKQKKGRYIILSVVFKLEKNGKSNISYKDLSEYFDRNKIGNPSITDVREAVVYVRSHKLPDWKLWGTAGSFFKNPVVTASDFTNLKSKYPELPGFPEPNGDVKVSLGWVLDKICNAKNLSGGNVHVYENQALVVVAKPGSTSAEVVEFTRNLQNLVKEKTGIIIEAEVEWVN